MSGEQRLTRLRNALDARLSHVSCAIQAVHHRHNVSAILRTCDALGIHRVDLVEGHFVPNRGAARGAERWLDLRHQLSPEAAVRDLKDAGYRIYVADLADDVVTPEQVPLDRPVCIWMGAELQGVAPEARAAADGVIHIPMRGLAQSLNVSVAAGMLLRPVAERARLLGEGALLPQEQREATWQAWLDRDRETQRAVSGLVVVEPPPTEERPGG
jgi:tRNA (guanosine-2'-O-)-methyltransferase